MAKATVTSPVTKSNPRWAKDYTIPNTAIAHFPAKVDASQFVDKDAVKVTATAIAAQGATSITITAVTFTGGVSKIPKGTTLYFGGTKIAVTTADYTGGTTINVAALPTALAISDTANYLPFGTRVAIDSGTLVGRTYAERDANTAFGPAVSSDDEVYLTLFDNVDANANADIELYRHGRTVAENYLPQWTAGANYSGNSALLAVLRAKYVCIKGQW